MNRLIGMMTSCAFALVAASPALAQTADVSAPTLSEVLVPSLLVSDAELDQSRGGYLIADKIAFQFGAIVSTFENGALALRSQLTWTPQGAVVTQTTGADLKSGNTATVASGAAAASQASVPTPPASSPASSNTPSQASVSNAPSSTPSVASTVASAVAGATSTATAAAAPAQTVASNIPAPTGASGGPAPAPTSNAGPQVAAKGEAPATGVSEPTGTYVTSTGTTVIHDLSDGKITSVLLNTDSGQTFSQQIDATLTLPGFAGAQRDMVQSLAGLRIADDVAIGGIRASGY